MSGIDRIGYDRFLPEKRDDEQSADESLGYEIDFRKGPRRIDGLAEPSLPNESFGARLRRTRVAMGLSQTQLASALRVSVPAVCGWEKDRAKPRPARIGALCDLLDLSTSDLLGHESRADRPDMISYSREQIARAVGTTVDKVRIIIEF